MTWKDILKSEKYGQKPRDKNMKERYDRLSPKPSHSPETEKAHCGSEKLDDDDPFEKKLVGNQKKIDDMMQTKAGFLKVLDFFYGAMK